MATEIISILKPAKKPAKQYIAGIFDVEDRLNKLTQMGDALVALNAMIDWEAFRSDIEVARKKKEKRKSPAGAKPIDAILMFKILVLQQLNNLSDDRIEFQIRDRLSFMRFLDLHIEDRVPDAKTIWLFRETLKHKGIAKKLFARFEAQLQAQGFVAQGGQMVDATFVEVPKSRNSREDNATIKAGEIPPSWQGEDAASVHKRAQKDTDARWAKKNEEKHFGYKNHINADAKNKIIRDYDVTSASVHDSNVFDQLLDHSEDENGDKRAAYADSAYRAKAQEERLAQANIESHINEKGTRAGPLNEAQKESNKENSRTRSRVEHIFGAQAQMGGHIVRTIGAQRAFVKITMMNLVYNMKRFVFLCGQEILKAMKNDRKDAFVVP